MIDPKDQSYQGNRMRPLCGERSPGPLLPRRPHMEGAPWKPRTWATGRLWDRLRGRQAVWVCRDARGHSWLHRRNVWRLTTVDYSKGLPRGRKQLRLFKLGKLSTVTRREEWRLWPSKYRSVGHHYTFNGYERRIVGVPPEELWFDHDAQRKAGYLPGEKL